MARSRVLPALLAAGLVFAGCGGDDDAASPTTVAPPTTVPETAPTTAPSDHGPGDDRGARHHGTGERVRLLRSRSDVADFVDARGLNGAGLVVVDREDGIVHEEYWGELGPDRISLVASSSKMVTAGVLLRPQDDEPSAPTLSSRPTAPPGNELAALLYEPVETAVLAARS